MPIIKALEPLHPAWIEDPCQCENYDEMARIAQSTSIPIAAGERVFTRWAFRELLERGAAKILNPDPCHVGGIFETRLIAGNGGDALCRRCTPLSTRSDCIGDLSATRRHDAKLSCLRNM